MSAQKFKQPKSVLILIATAQSEILLLRRADHPKFWQSVTGSVELGEALKQTAVREVFEETGLQCTEQQLQDCYCHSWFSIWPEFKHRYAPEVIYNLEHVFSLILPSKPNKITINPREHLEYRWLPAAPAYDLASSATNKYAIDKFIARTSK